MKKITNILMISLFLIGINFSFGQTAIFNEAGGGALPLGWSSTNNNTSQPIDKNSYWLVQPGNANPNDIIVTKSYDLSTFTSAEFKVKIKSFGPGGHVQLKVEVSYDGGVSYTESLLTSFTTTTYVTQTLNLSTVSSQVKLRFSVNSSTGRGIRLQNLILNAFAPTSTLCSGGTTTWDLGFAGFAWSNGVPNDTKAAIINTYYDTQIAFVGGANIDACTLEIISTLTKSGSLIVGPGDYVRVVNDIVNAGSITIRNNGSLVQVEDLATYTGTGINIKTVETTPLQDTDRFTYFSSPIVNGTLALFSSFATANWGYDNTIQNWSYLGDATATNSMVVGSSYAVRGGSGGTEIINFSGLFNNGVITQPLAFDVYNNVVGDYVNPLAGNDDANFVGNPYPSAISADNLIMNNDISAVYIWTHNSAAVGGAYANNDYIECVSGTCTELNGGSTTSYNGFIASGQGFFVTATAATSLTFNNAMRVTGNNDQFRSVENQKLWLDMTTVQGYGKQIALTFTGNGTANYDVKYESRSLTTANGLGFYSYNAVNDKLSINDTGLLSEDRTIPLGFYTNDPIIDGATISIAHSQNLEDTNVYLIDNLLNVTHDLKVSDYQITITEPGETNDRFEIVFNRDPLSTNDDIIVNDTLVVSNQNEAEIKVNMLDGSIITNLKAFDVLGKLVIDMKANSNDFTINTNFKPGQVLFIKATLENGQVLSNKFMKL